MKRFLLRLSYDGSSFSGWQKQTQSRNLRTVQDTIEDCLSGIAKQQIKTTGSSRTDTGVHALSQYTHFDFPVNMTAEQLRLALSATLPKDIKILAAQIVSSGFHCRFDAIGRSYKFEIAKELTPFNRLYRSYFPRHTINVENISGSIHLFKGENDFELFCKKDEGMDSFISIVTEISLTENEDGYTFSISADRFLHNMVRRIVGTLVRLSDSSDLHHVITELLKKNREYLHLVYTAPPQGLYLKDVYYPRSCFVAPDN